MSQERNRLMLGPHKKSGILFAVREKGSGDHLKKKEFTQPKRHPTSWAWLQIQMHLNFPFYKNT